MKINRIVVTGLLAVCCTLATFLPSQVQAQTNTDITKDAFAFSTTITITNFNFTVIPIPAGKRLVVQNVNMSGGAIANPYVVPIVLFVSTLGSEPSVYHYFAPPKNLQDSTQFYEDKQTTIYADQLSVSPAYAGFTPSFMSFNVTVEGYLVDAPKATPPPS